MPGRPPPPIQQDETGYQTFENLPGRYNRPAVATKWYEDSKLGLFIHWGLYAVPGWATNTNDQVIDFLDPATDWATWFKNNAYSEWILHTMRISGSPAARHIEETYGKNFDYYKFAPIFNERVTSRWNSDAWADLFSRSGFRYVVLTTKHHDGFCLWPTKSPSPYFPAGTPPVATDIVGKLTNSVRKSGMEMGLYYSGGFDWSYDASNQREFWPVTPATPEYAKVCDQHVRELINSYKPAIFWNDIAWPAAPPSELDKIFGEYYESVPHGIVNDRFFPVPRIPGNQFRDSFMRKIGDIVCPEYQSFPKPVARKWETCRGISHSFGYNGNETEAQQIGHAELVRSLLDISSKNGNLLLGIGPRTDGSIPLLQRRRLRVLGQWLSINGEGFYGTRPWWDGEAEGSLEHKWGSIATRAVTKDRADGLYDVYVGVLGDEVEGKATVKGFSKLGVLLQSNAGSKVVLLTAPEGASGSGKPWEARPSTVDIPRKVNKDGSIEVAFPLGISSKISVEVPIAKPGDTTGRDTPDSEERYERRVLAFTLRFGPFADVATKL